MHFLKEVSAFWLETWKTNKLLFWIEAISTILGMTASTLITFGIPNPNFLIIFICYILSAIGLAWCSYVRKNTWMVVLMAYYTFTTAVGLYRLFL